MNDVEILRLVQNVRTGRNQLDANEAADLFDHLVLCLFKRLRDGNQVYALNPAGGVGVGSRPFKFKSLIHMNNMVLIPAPNQPRQMPYSN